MCGVHISQSGSTYSNALLDVHAFALQRERADFFTNVKHKDVQKVTGVQTSKIQCHHLSLTGVQNIQVYFYFYVISVYENSLYRRFFPNVSIPYN